MGLEEAFQGRRSMEQALVDLIATHQKRPTPELAEMILRLQAELTTRQTWSR